MIDLEHLISWLKTEWFVDESRRQAQSVTAIVGCRFISKACTYVNRLNSTQRSRAIDLH